ncbi:permease prefix domain 1-containing protein [Intestinibacter sp.]
MNLQEKRIEEFLESACRFVSTEERANDIQDELRDHISNYIEEYREEGMDESSATNEALKQMGDPKILGELYKEKILPKKKWKLIVIGILFIFMSLFSIYSIKINNQHYIIPIVLLIVLFLSYSCQIYNFININKLRKSLEDREVVVYIKGNKKKPNIPIVIIFLPIYIFDFILSIGDIYAMLGSLCLISSSILVFINELPIDQDDISVIYNDSIFIGDNLIYWDEIMGYRWMEEKVDNKTNKYLEIKKIKKNKVKSTIVSTSQVNLIDEVLESKNIEYIQYF